MNQIIIEQRLLDIEITDSKPSIYTSGAYLVPMKVNIKEKEYYVWVVSQFNDDTYIDGNICSPLVLTNDFNDLIRNEE